MALLAFGIGAAGVLGALIAAGRFYFRTKIGQVLTGDQRRKAFPKEEGMVLQTRKTLKATDIIVKRKYVEVDGEQFFWQTIEPVRGAPTHIFLWIHGYQSHSDMYVEQMREVALQGALVVMIDLPCHGRSDGMLTYIPSWWIWVDKVWRILETIVRPLRDQYPTAKKMFVGGASLGGGLATCLCVMRPTFFSGMILIAPMLFVSQALKPPQIIQTIFKSVLGPFYLTWPLAPAKDMSTKTFRVPEQGLAANKVNPCSMKGHKPRLATALQLGFVFPEWMEEHLREVRIPFLVMHGTADEVTDPEMSKKLYEVAATPMKDKTLKLYEGGCHGELIDCTAYHAEALNLEWLPEQVAMTQQALKDMNEWMASRL